MGSTARIKKVLFFLILLLSKATCRSRAFVTRRWKKYSNRDPVVSGWIKVRGGASKVEEEEKESSCSSSSPETNNNNNNNYRGKLPPALNLTVHEDLLTAQECNTVIALAKPFLVASKVGRPPRVEPSLRISQSCKLPRLPVPALWRVEQKLASAAGVPVERGEDLQVGAYPIGNYYGMHCDERKGGRPNGGGRLATALAYLNTMDPAKATGGCTVFSGKPFDLRGEPDFPLGDIRVRELKRLCDCGDDDTSAVRVGPRRGRVITFRNLAPCPAGTGDAGPGGTYGFVSESAHGACPVVNATDPPATGKDATKFVVQQWFGLENEVNVARHPGLVAHLGLGVASAFRVPPLFDLASPNGMPVATVSKGSNDDAVVAEDVPSPIPGIGAIRLRGRGACIDSPGQPTANATGCLGENGLAAAIWFKLGGTAADSEQRLFRAGPHELFVNEEGRFVWTVGGGNHQNATAQGLGKLLPNQWYHVSLVVARPTGSGETTKAELYLSVPGQPPRSPVEMKVVVAANNTTQMDGVSVGGGCRHVESNYVDLTVTDFYVLNDDYTGEGHRFAYAIGFYDPGAGF